MKKILLSCLCILSLSACNDETEEEGERLVGFSASQIAGNPIIEKKNYKIQDNKIYISYPENHPLGYELSQHYFTDQGVTLDPIKTTDGTWYLLGSQVQFSDKVLNYQPANLVKDDNLFLNQDLIKIDISGQPVTKYLGQWIFESLPLSQQVLFEDYYNALLQQNVVNFPKGSTCWMINKVYSNKDYIEFSSDGTAPLYIDSNRTAPATETWQGITWSRDESSLAMKFTIDNIDYSGQYHHQSGTDEYVPPYTGKYCNFVSEIAADTMIKTWKGEP
ncbi:hypothetical protein [Acinetobacter lactucae]|uniref:Uncharacterized protein n=1 Tax=Acinetobacter lactucae TaxID=1785128 RepID=A0A1V0KF92_9GAMM|nr:hypothetical protein [Acinetobacter lactucae]ARD30348.1 hypothetical protein OTEC02_17225 [Acinetobacter lactucae]RSO57134.1 hypothetical protein EA756_10020 [Acinetobacter lactucae]